jgi:hypothetical protein
MRCILNKVFFVCCIISPAVDIFYRYGLKIVGDLTARTTELLKDNAARLPIAFCAFS